MTKSYSITSKYQVTVPKQIREELKLTNKDKVYFSRRGKEVLLKKAPSLKEVAAEMGAKFRASSLKPASEEEIKNARHEFYKKGLKW